MKNWLHLLWVLLMWRHPYTHTYVYTHMCIYIHFHTYRYTKKHTHSSMDIHVLCIIKGRLCVHDNLFFLNNSALVLFIIFINLFFIYMIFLFTKLN